MVFVTESVTRPVALTFSSGSGGRHGRTIVLNPRRGATGSREVVVAVRRAVIHLAVVGVFFAGCSSSDADFRSDVEDAREEDHQKELAPGETPVIVSHVVSVDGYTGLPRVEVTSDLACRGRPGRMSRCPSPIRRSSATTS
jgi:hypothetical protein